MAGFIGCIIFAVWTFAAGWSAGQSGFCYSHVLSYIEFGIDTFRRQTGRSTRRIAFDDLPEPDRLYAAFRNRGVLHRITDACYFYLDPWSPMDKIDSVRYAVGNSGTYQSTDAVYSDCTVSSVGAGRERARRVFPLSRQGGHRLCCPNACYPPMDRAQFLRIWRIRFDLNHGGPTFLTSNNPSASGDFTENDPLVEQAPNDVKSKWRMIGWPPRWRSGGSMIIPAPS